MKVLVVAPNPFYPENRDGISKIIFNLFKFSPETEWSFLSLKKESIEIFANVKVIGETFHVVPDSKMKKLLRFFSSKPYTVAKREELLYLANVIKNCSGDYDVIHVFTMSLLELIDFLPAEVVKKIKFSAIDSLSLYHKRRAYNSGFLLKIVHFYEYLKVRSFEAKYLARLSSVHYVSRVDADFSSDHKKKFEVLVIPNGVDLTYFKPQSEGHTNDILFIGHLDYFPNSYAAVWITTKLAPLLKGLKISIVGKNPPKEIAKSKNVKILGYVDDLREIIATSKIFICPLFHGAGIKNKVLEMMAAGKIVVGSLISFEGIPVENGVHAIVVNSNDPKDWRTRIDEVLENYSNYNQVGVNARTLIEEKFSWQEVTQSYRTWYED